MTVPQPTEGHCEVSTQVLDALPSCSGEGMEMTWECEELPGTQLMSECMWLTLNP